MRRLLVILLFALPFHSFAQYQQEWQIDQNYYEQGILFFDYNEDGKIDLTKILGNGFGVYDGNNDWSQLWTVIDDDYEYVSIWDIYTDSNDSRFAIVTATNWENNPGFKIEGFTPLAETPEWSSGHMPGSVMRIDKEDLDNDNEIEIILGYNEYLDEEEAYNSRFVILDLSTGAVEFQSNLYNAYMDGPYVGDIDSDDSVEILVNLYDIAAQTSTLHVFSIDGETSVSTKSLVPDDIELGQNFPNPFNPGTVIPVNLKKPASAKVTVVDILGRKIAILHNGTLQSGLHQFYWNGRNQGGQPVSSGTYFYEIELDGHQVRRPMVLLK